jgi:hypothetical protein
MVDEAGGGHNAMDPEDFRPDEEQLFAVIHHQLLANTSAQQKN